MTPEEIKHAAIQTAHEDCLAAQSSDDLGSDGYRILVRLWERAYALGRLDPVLPPEQEAERPGAFAGEPAVTKPVLTAPADEIDAALKTHWDSQLSE